MPQDQAIHWHAGIKAFDAGSSIITVLVDRKVDDLGFVGPVGAS